VRVAAVPGSGPGPSKNHEPQTRLHRLPLHSQVGLNTTCNALAKAAQDEVSRVVLMQAGPGLQQATGSLSKSFLAVSQVLLVKSPWFAGERVRSQHQKHPFCHSSSIRGTAKGKGLGLLEKDCGKPQQG
jgi:hypothetical protein